MHSVTTSIRLSAALNKQLEEAVFALHRGKNWIINQAIIEYVAGLHHHQLAEDARSQSLLACAADAEVGALWEDNTDTSGWV